jgi:hypothetical protein
MCLNFPQPFWEDGEHIGDTRVPTQSVTVFFSYARSDADFVLQVTKSLRDDGVGVWIDQLDIPSGARWDESVESALRECSCLVVVMSPASVSSPNVLDEVSYALEDHKTVVPLLLAKCSIPFRLKRIQHVDFTLGYELGYKQLLAALRRLRPPETPEPEPAAKAPPVREPELQAEWPAPELRRLRRMPPPRARPAVPSRGANPTTPLARIQRAAPPSRSPSPQSGAQAPASEAAAQPGEPGAAGEQPVVPPSEPVVPKPEPVVPSSEPVSPQGPPAPPAREPIAPQPAPDGNALAPAQLSSQDGVTRGAPAPAGNPAGAVREPDVRAAELDASIGATNAPTLEQASCRTVEQEREPVAPRSTSSVPPIQAEVRTRQAAAPAIRAEVRSRQAAAPVIRAAVRSRQAIANPAQSTAPSRQGALPPSEPGAPSRQGTSLPAGEAAQSRQGTLPPVPSSAQLRQEAPPHDQFAGQSRQGASPTAPPATSPQEPEAPHRFEKAPSHPHSADPDRHEEAVFYFEPAPPPAESVGMEPAGQPPPDDESVPMPARQRAWWRYVVSGVVVLVAAGAVAYLFTPLGEQVDELLATEARPPVVAPGTSIGSGRQSAEVQAPAPQEAAPPSPELPAPGPETPATKPAPQAGGPTQGAVAGATPGSQPPVVAKQDAKDERKREPKAHEDAGNKQKPETQPGTEKTSAQSSDEPEAEDVPTPENTTELAASDEPATPQHAATDAAVMDLVKRYVAAQDSNDIDGLLALYDDRVDFHEYKLAGRDYIRNDRQQFVDKWPKVATVLVGPIEITWSDDTTVDVVFTTMFHVREPPLENPGKTRTKLTARMTHGGLKIVSEHQEELTSPS